MADLLKTIRNYNEEAASVIKEAGLRTDLAIKSLTREDLRDLIPEPEKFQVRRAIYEIIHKQKPADALLRELKEFIPHESLRGEVMADLLKTIRNYNKEAASVIKEAGLRTDLAIKSLTREDLRDLIPEPEKFQVRRAIYEIIHKQKSADALLRELNEFIPHESLRAALNNNGVLVDYLQMLKDMKGQMDNVQESKNAKPQEEPDKGPLSDISPMMLDESQTGGQSQGAQDLWPGSGTSGASGSPVLPPIVPNGINSHGARGAGNRSGSSYGQSGVPPQRPQVMYRSVVSGKTFGADVQLMKKVEDKGHDSVQFITRSEDHKITVLFCPISSQVGADVDAAMSDVEDDDKPVILVLMHHTREPKHTTNVRTWTDYKKVVLHVHVFYHETKNGLLSCQQNKDSISTIWSKLLEYSFPRYQVTSASALGARSSEYDFYKWQQQQQQ